MIIASPIELSLNCRRPNVYRVCNRLWTAGLSYNKSDEVAGFVLNGAFRKIFVIKSYDTKEFIRCLDCSVSGAIYKRPRTWQEKVC